MPIINLITLIKALKGWGTSLTEDLNSIPSNQIRQLKLPVIPGDPTPLTSGGNCNQMHILTLLERGVGVTWALQGHSFECAGQVFPGRTDSTISWAGIHAYVDNKPDTQAATVTGSFHHLLPPP